MTLRTDPAGGAFRRETTALLREAGRTAAMLFRIMAPIGIAAKAMTDLGLTVWLSRGLEPAMGLAGLPGSMGLVWGTAMLTSLYGGIAVFVTLAPSEPLTVAQVTVLGAMMLTAHALPVELRIAQKAGARLRLLLPLRVACALALGTALNAAYRLGGFLQEPHALLWRPPPQAASWADWAAGQARTLAILFVVILALMALLRGLDRSGAAAALSRALAPPLRALGMGAAVAPVTLVGLTLGLSYGGGLIVREARTGRIDPRDIGMSLILMSLCHSLIEDTMLLMLLGAHPSGVLGGRLLFSLAAVFAAGRILRRLPDRILERHVLRPVSGAATANPPTPREIPA